MTTNLGDCQYRDCRATKPTKNIASWSTNIWTNGNSREHHNTTLQYACQWHTPTHPLVAVFPLVVMLKLAVKFVAWHCTWPVLICLSCMWKWVFCSVRLPMTAASSPMLRSSRSAAARKSSTGIIGFGRSKKAWKSCWQKSTCQVSLLLPVYVN